jgi:tetratricopeptide (TPR) repeat protein
VSTPALLPASGPADRKWIALVVVTTLIMTITFGQAIDTPFLFDDHLYLTDNAKLRSLPLGELWRLLTESYNAFEFLPLRDLSYRLDLAWFGLDPRFFRAHNILLYVVVTGLVFVATKRICEIAACMPSPRSVLVAAVAAALFAVHPSHVEAVIWISGRKDLLAALFSLLSIWAAVEIGASPERAHKLFAASMVAFLCALMSKAAAMAMTPIFAAVAWTHWERAEPRLSRPLLAGLAAAPVAIALLFLNFFYDVSAVAVPQHYGGETLTRFLAIVGWLTRIALLPEARHLYYPVVEAGFHAMAWFGLAVVAGAFACGWIAFRRRSIAWLALAMAFAFSLPYGQLMPFGTHSLACDRFAFLMVWPVGMLLALSATTRVRAMLLCVLGLAWMVQAAVRANEWKSYRNLLKKDVVAFQGDYLPVAQMISSVLLPEGRAQEAANLARTIAHPRVRRLVEEVTEAAIQTRSSSRSGESDRAIMAQLWQLGKTVRAMEPDVAWNIPLRYIYTGFGAETVSSSWRNLVARSPSDPTLRYNAGLWFRSIGAYQDAAQHFAAAMTGFGRDSPHFAAAARNYGSMLTLRGDFFGAESALREAALAEPKSGDAHCLLAALYDATNRQEESAESKAKCQQSNVPSASS